MSDGSVTIHKQEITTADIETIDRRMGLSAATDGRHSMFFLLGLHVAELQGRMSAERVIRQIRAMEGQTPPTGTKPATQFKGPWLGGLWHQHYQFPGLASMAMNLRNGWKSEGMSPWFRQRMAEAEAGTGPKYFTVEDVPALANDLVSGTYQRRKDAQALTGEWIVYAVHQGKNYYLAIWEHAHGDEMLRREIERLCVPQFPFLSAILPAVPS